MRYLTAKPRPRKKTPHPSAVGCHLLPPEKAYLYPARSCLLLRVAKRHEGTEFHSGGVKEPECARAAARQGDRSAVDEECALFPTALPSTIQLLFPRGRPSVARFCTPVFPPTSRLHIDFRFPPVGVGASTTRTPSFPPTFRQQYQPLLPVFAFSCRRRGTAERWMRSVLFFPLTLRQRYNHRSPPIRKRL